MTAGSAGSGTAVLRFFYGLLTVSVVLVALATVYNAGSIGTMRSSIADVTATLDLQAEIGALLADNQAVETYALRYLLSGHDDHLRGYVEATFALDDRLLRLRDKFADTPLRADTLRVLQAAVGERNERFRQSIAEYQATGIDAAIRRVREGEGASRAAAIRRIALDLASEEGRQLSRRQQQLESAIVQSSTTVLMVNGLALIAGLIAFVAIRRSTGALEAGRLAELHARELERASREKSAFLASISHEIRTPMNAVFGFSQLLARTRLEPQAQEYIKAIQTSGQALLALINDILDLSRIEAGKLLLHPTPTDLRELVDATLSVFAEAASRKQIGLSARVAPALPAVLEVDAHRLRQVLLNLLGNAVKYTDQGEVQVRVRSTATATDGCTIEIEVHDSGIGIPPERQAKLFEPFYRAVDDDERGGSGLGLAIVARLVAMMQGHIAVDSEPGRGSCFRVTLEGLPIASRPADDPAAVDTEIDFAALTPSCILIVDDVAWNRELLGAYLADSGHRLLFASNGAEAVQRVAEHPVDVVLMDLRMPVMDGREATRRLRAAAGAAAPRVIAVTASSMSRDDGEAAHYYDGFVRKPVSRDVLFQALLEQIGRRQREPGDEPEAAAPDTASGEVGANDRAQALAAVAALVADELPEIAAAMRISELRRLGERLVEHGQAGGLSAIAALGRRLLRAVDRFDTVAMESLLRQLPEHVQADQSPAS